MSSNATQTVVVLVADSNLAQFRRYAVQRAVSAQLGHLDHEEVGVVRRKRFELGLGLGVARGRRGEPELAPQPHDLVAVQRSPRLPGRAPPLEAVADLDEPLDLYFAVADLHVDAVDGPDDVAVMDQVRVDEPGVGLEPFDEIAAYVPRPELEPGVAAPVGQ